MLKKIIFIVVVVIAGFIWLVFFNRNTSVAPVVQFENKPPDQTQTAQNVGQLDIKPQRQTGVEKIITYTDNGFSPATITVTNGEKVIFKNESSGGFWPASDPHPIHTGYPTTGGCRGSTFDSCGSVVPGGSWAFTFDISGTWGYHDHLNANHTGKIIVR